MSGRLGATVNSINSLFVAVGTKLSKCFCGKTLKLIKQFFMLSHFHAYTEHLAHAPLHARATQAVLSEPNAILDGSTRILLAFEGA